MTQNATTICQELTNLYNSCIVICDYTNAACLNATEPSFGNAQLACSDYKKNCIIICDKINSLCFANNNYPLNTRYDPNTANLAAPIFLTLAACAAIFCICRTFKDNNMPITTTGGLMFGFAAGGVASWAVREALLPPLKDFQQYNPADETSANLYAAVLGFLITAACMYLSFKIATKARSSMLYYFNKPKIIADSNVDATSRNQATWRQLRLV